MLNEKKKCGTIVEVFDTLSSRLWRLIQNKVKKKKTFSLDLTFSWLTPIGSDLRRFIQYSTVLPEKKIADQQFTSRVDTAGITQRLWSTNMITGNIGVAVMESQFIHWGYKFETFDKLFFDSCCFESC